MTVAARLIVILAGTVVGTLDRIACDALRFTYERGLPDVTPLSLSMPPRTNRHSGEVVERFLRALLPESDEACAAIERRFPGTDRHDLLSLLGAVGKDCPGAVQFCRPDEVDATLARPSDLSVQDESAIEARLAELDMEPDAWAVSGEHWSLGGTQSKFALRRAADAWFEAHGAEPTTHIFKPGVRGLSAQALLEHISMRAASDSGLDVAYTEHLEFKSPAAVVITRFDRATDTSGAVTRLHQEDLCQALGVDKKYQEYGGPGPLDIIQLLRDRSLTARDARQNVAAFVDGLIFNTVVYAPDAHARNYAVLLDRDRVTLAPLFDVSTSLPYALAGRGRVLSMSIDGEYVADRVTREHWLRFADAADLDGDRIVTRAKQIAEDAPAALRKHLAHASDWTKDVPELRARLTEALDVYMPAVATNLGL